MHWTWKFAMVVAVMIYASLAIWGSEYICRGALAGTALTYVLELVPCWRRRRHRWT